MNATQFWQFGYKKQLENIFNNPITRDQTYYFTTYHIVGNSETIALQIGEIQNINLTGNVFQVHIPNFDYRTQIDDSVFYSGFTPNTVVMFESVNASGQTMYKTFEIDIPEVNNQSPNSKVLTFDLRETVLVKNSLLGYKVAVSLFPEYVSGRIEVTKQIQGITITKIN
ncbi:MAG: hypothetical protein Q4C98_10475 [Capnocytophaga sp.]|nr:hypothetical protein [Capnocytophaga sp.]